MSREWDATTYADLPLPHVAWGAGVLDRLPLAGDERVLDAGCGPGRDTLRLLDRLPRGQVVAVDGSRAMLDVLRGRLADRPDRDRVQVVHADLTEPLAPAGLTGSVDAVMSVATFHWVPDHGRLFANLAAVLRPGGRLVAECGGAGNIAAVVAATDAALDDLPASAFVTPLPRPFRPHHFEGVGATRSRLLAAGFADPQVRLRPDPVAIERGPLLDRYVATVMLGAELSHLRPAVHDEFVADVTGRLAEPVIDYVRLEFEAVRA